MQNSKPQTGLISLATSWQLRGVAMLMILFVHSVNEYPAVMQQPWSRLLLVPHWGVIGSAVFLLLSGYGMLCSLQKRGLAFDGRYWMRKAKGLLLPYLVAFAVTALALSVYDGKYEGGYSFDASHLLRLNLADGNELWFFKTIVAEYVLLMVLNLLRMRVRGQVVVMAVVHAVVIGLMVGCGWPRYWWASDAFFVVGMAASLCLVRSEIVPALPERWAWTRWTSRGLTYIGRNSICFYLLEIAVMWMLPSSLLPWPLFFLLTVALTAVLTELYRRSFGR